MKEFDNLPKNIKKTIRYISQDAPLRDLNKIEQLITEAIKARKKSLYR